MKRIAAPIFGGILSSFLLELLVYPAIFAVWKLKTDLTLSQIKTNGE
jgi:Cu(I)/Ag(I) efflux system membrane protein CusA/SilA